MVATLWNLAACWRTTRTFYELSLRWFGFPIRPGSLELVPAAAVVVMYAVRSTCTPVVVGPFTEGGEWIRGFVVYCVASSRPYAMHGFWGCQRLAWGLFLRIYSTEVLGAGLF